MENIHTKGHQFAEIPGPPVIIQGLCSSAWTHLSCAHGERVLACPTLLDSLSTSSAGPLDEIEGILDLTRLAMAREVELGDGKVEVMRGDINIDKLLRIGCKAGEKILAPLTGGVIGEGDPVDEIVFS